MQIEEIQQLKSYTPKHKIRILTATSLFDGHDASINIMRRLLQARGAEVIHLGHDRSALEVVQGAIQEDVQAIALSSYQGGHMEYFSYIRRLLSEAGRSEIKIFGGGGGVISLNEIKELEDLGIEKIYSPEDGQSLGLDGIIGHILRQSDFEFLDLTKDLKNPIPRALTLLENKKCSKEHLFSFLNKSNQKIPVLGITGTGGAGKSSLVDELLLRFLEDFNDLKIALICIDPSKKKTGGALLGDRIRVNSCANARIFLRSFATRNQLSELSSVTADALEILKHSDFDLIIVETSGIGQGNSSILDICDLSLYVMTCDYGASSQLEKIDMLDFADFVAINKFERPQALDAFKAVQNQIRRNRFKGVPQSDEVYNVFGTIASRFDDDGTSGLYKAVYTKLQNLGSPFNNLSFKDPKNKKRRVSFQSTLRHSLIDADSQTYLSDISKTVRTYKEWSGDQIKKVYLSECLEVAAEHCKKESIAQESSLAEESKKAWTAVDSSLKNKLDHWKKTVKDYMEDYYCFQVRDKILKVESSFTTLSHSKLPKVCPPKYVSKADVSRYLLLENLPGYFPFTAGIFPFRRTNEDPKRQFAGEGGPLRTNKRFHFLSKDDDAKRLSTAFDSVTLYGSDPDIRPDIFGKVGESGVSIAHLDDMKDLFSGFDLCDPQTSVSMTINGPAPMILAMFLNAAIDQKFLEYEKREGKPPSEELSKKIKAQVLKTVRGTVQADILKEDQAQNTCIFSIDFALKLMGDMEEYFIQHDMENYYSVSISGYHIAEAGANPITQLAFTLANGFTYVEYYLNRGFKIDDFAKNLAFFFSNGVDIEYSVLGRVARRIWAISMRDRYKASEKSQKLKYHIQTSGRSLHAQEMDFNDIRTTLQALMALYDNCNSLHTNAYDEALTTPTEDSVRRAMAIQMIINKEFGLGKCENVNQGAFIIEELTELVEEAVLDEFEKISSRGGVLGAMETQYQRSKIQEESLYYEHLKDTKILPIIGVNTYLKNSSETQRQDTLLIRASYEEKNEQLTRLEKFRKKASKEIRTTAIDDLKKSVIEQRNVFAQLMETTKVCSLGEISNALFEVGGKYRRSM